MSAKNKFAIFVVFQALIILIVVISYIFSRYHETKSLSKEPRLEDSPSRIKIIDRTRYSPSEKILTEDSAERETQEKFSSESISDLIAQADLETDQLKRRDMYTSIAKKWSLLDPQACLNWAMSLASPLDKSSVLIATVSRIVVSGDIVTAIDLVGKIPRGEFKDDAIVYTIKAIAKVDMNKALELVNSLSGEGAFRSAAGDIAKILAEQGKFGEMKEIWGNIPYGSFRDEFGFFMVHNICQDSPEEALNWVLGNSEFFESEASMRRVASEYARKDPLKALKSANLINNPNLKNSYLQELGKAWGRADPIMAGDWLLKVTAESGYGANKLLGDGIIAEWVQWDHDKAIAALDSIQDLSERNQAKLTAVQALAAFDPSSAANMIIPLLSPGSIESRNAIRKLTSSWMSRDPLAASQWIGSLVEGPLKDVSIGQLVSNILSKDKDIEMANSWAAQIIDPKIRAQVNANIDRTKP